MVKMDLPSSQSQATSAGSQADSRIAAYQQALKAIDQYAAADNLKGQAYTASKTYGSQVFAPIFKGLIMLSDAVKSSTAEMPAGYVSEVGGESLDSDALTADITELTASIDNYSMLLSNEEAKETVSQATVKSIKQSIDSETAQRKTLQDKLAKLLAFDAKSPSYFSEIPGLASAVDAGLAAAGTVSTSFALPADMSWATTINTNWASYQEDVKAGYQAAVDKVKNGQPLTEADILAIQRYQRNHPDVTIDSEVQKAMEAYDVDKNYKAVVKKAEAGKALTEADIKAIEAYQKAHPDTKINQKVETAKVKYLETQYNAVVGKIYKGEALTDKDIDAMNAYMTANPQAMVLATTDPMIQNAFKAYFAKSVVDTVGAVRENDWVERAAIFYKMYPKSFVEKVLKSDVIVDAINASKHREAIYLALSKYEKLGDVLKLNVAGDMLKKLDKATSAITSPIKTFASEAAKKIPGYKALSKSAWLGKSAKFLGKAGTVLTYVDLAITGVSSGLNEYAKTKHVGKAVTGGVIDTIKSIGPLEGATIGASIGSVVPGVGTALGAGIGAVIGTVNTLVQLWKPDIYDDAKKLAYKGIDLADKGVKAAGKIVGQGVEAVKKGASEIVGNVGKAITSIKIPKLNWG